MRVTSEVYLEYIRTSTMEIFYEKNSIVDVQLDCKYADKHSHSHHAYIYTHLLKLANPIKLMKQNQNCQDLQI